MIRIVKNQNSCWALLRIQIRVKKFMHASFACRDINTLSILSMRSHRTKRTWCPTFSAILPLGKTIVLLRWHLELTKSTPESEIKAGILYCVVVVSTVCLSPLYGIHTQASLSHKSSYTGSMLCSLYMCVCSLYMVGGEGEAGDVWWGVVVPIMSLSESSAKVIGYF